MPDVILRTACLDLIRKAAEARDVPVTFAVGDDKVTMTAGDYTLIAKVVEGTYPDYQRTIPQSPPFQAVFDRDDFNAALGRVGLAIDGKQRWVKMTLARDLATISATSTQHGEGAEEVPCQWSGDRTEIGFNLKYMRDAMGALDVDTIGIGITDPSSPTLITSPSTPEISLVVVPMRI